MPSVPNGKTMTPEPQTKLEVEHGSGNVFADIGLPDPELHLAKAEVVFQIQFEIRRRRLSVAKAAVFLGMGAPKLQELLRGRVRPYTLDRLVRLLGKLGRRVEITVRDAGAR